MEVMIFLERGNEHDICTIKIYIDHCGNEIIK